MTKIICPNHEHIEQILSLNRKYLLSKINSEEKEKGFIRIEYSYDDITRIIDNKEIVVAITENIIIGYYLIGKSSESNFLDYQRKKVNELFNVDFDTNKIGYGAQAIIKLEYRGLNLLEDMLNMLIIQLNHKYLMLFSSVTKVNGNALKAHTKGGYKILAEDEDKYFIALNLAN